MEKKEFPISKSAITWILTIHLITALFFMLLTYLVLTAINTWAVILSFIFITIWAVFLFKRPHKIIIDRNKIVFKSLLFSPNRIDVNNLSSIIVGGAGGYTRFNLEKKSVITLSEIENKDELFNYILSLNPNIEIKHVAGVRKALSALGRILLTIIVIFIIGIYAYALYRCSTTGPSSSRYNSDANADIKNAYTCAQLYFDDHPNGVVTLSLLKKYGFDQHHEVEVKIISGTKNDLKISSTHTRGDKIYEVDADAKITFRKKE